MKQSIETNQVNPTNPTNPTNQTNQTNPVNTLAQECKDNNQLTMELYEAMTGMIHKQANRFRIPAEEIISEGWLGLTRCLECWKPELGDFALASSYILASHFQQYWYKNGAAVTYSGAASRLEAVPTTISPADILDEQGNSIGDSIFGSVAADDFFTLDLTKGLDTLNDDERVVLTSRGEGASYDEIIEELGHSRQWVNNKINSGREKLIKFMNHGVQSRGSISVT